jgi:LPXTG-motif cell wall-anchored protein
MPGLGFTDQEYFRCLRGGCIGLGASEVTPPPPEGFVKAAEVTTLPRAGETQAGDERDKFFRLKNPLMWAAFAGAAAIVGGGGYVLYRRRSPSGFGENCPKGKLWLESREKCVDARAYWDDPDTVLRKLGPRRRRSR